ncbi:MAG: quinone oxidoreductase, partial [Betaproteobacteria bacterium]|nr:quinone oxidoreductase [Betaproteobacteria bacterium]
MSLPLSRSIQIDQHGGPEVMRLVHIAVGEPGPGEVRIAHRAVGL